LKGVEEVRHGNGR
jgi:hypothetical protein